MLLLLFMSFTLLMNVAIKSTDCAILLRAIFRMLFFLLTVVAALIEDFWVYVYVMVDIFWLIMDLAGFMGFVDLWILFLMDTWELVLSLIDNWWIAFDIWVVMYLRLFFNAGVMMIFFKLAGFLFFNFRIQVHTLISMWFVFWILINWLIVQV